MAPRTDLSNADKYRILKHKSDHKLNDTEAAAWWNAANPTGALTAENCAWTLVWLDACHHGRRWHQEPRALSL